MRRVILIMVIYQIIFGCFRVNAYDNDYITRGDCLTYIMLTIGVPKNDGNEYMYTYTPEQKNAMYSDFVMASNDEILDMIEKFKNDCIFTSGPDLVNLAIEHTSIVYGDYVYTSKEYSGKNYTGIYFGYLRYVTLEECLAFMVRCLSDSNVMDLSDLETTTRLAKEYNLIVSTDAFYDTPQYVITKEDFSLLLSRFLSQSIYLYFNGPDANDFRINKNNQPAVYIDFLNERYGDNYAQKLLQIDKLNN